MSANTASRYCADTCRGSLKNPVSAPIIDAFDPVSNSRKRLPSRGAEKSSSLRPASSTKLTLFGDVPGVPTALAIVCAAVCRPSWSTWLASCLTFGTITRSTKSSTFSVRSRDVNVVSMCFWLLMTSGMLVSV